MIFQTERFVLRPLTPEDATETYRSWFNEDTARMGIASALRPPSIEKLRHFIRERAEREDVLFLGIFSRESGEHIGNVKFEPISRAQGFAVMGILVGDRSWWGKGVAVEILRVTGRWLAKEAGVREIVLGVRKDNVAAKRSYEKAGFRVVRPGRIKINPEIHDEMVWVLDHEAEVGH